uniref:Histidine kinase/HSP90-like ATPase domain-containing protein n=1 Tax=Arcella intermedia TaxID=1963864 RepID=A0A6B2KYS1_9EUKA
MGIIINSLYSNREIFLRELISNAADAITKIRFLSLKDASVLGETPQFEIRIKYDAENKLLHIRDTGVGMTKDDLVNNLGSIAKSGTKEFLEKVSGSGDAVETIGQFGVGFYSSFLVADKVTVTSKNNEDDQYIWESTTADPSAYSVAKDPRGNTLGRGTLITLHVRDDAVEFLNNEKLQNLILKYNQFISFPIFLYAPRTESRQVEPEAPAAESVIEGEDISVTEEEEAPKEPKIETYTVWGWERINRNPPLWARSKSEIEKSEYDIFYKEVLGAGEDPLEHLHFKAEGDVEFTALVYVPSTLPYGFWEPNYKSQLKLYVKKVFITDNFSEMIPQYLAFIRGVIDSDDFDLNVSREILQESNTLAIIKKKLVRKILALFQEMADDEENKEKWDTFYKTFSTSLKLGVLNDQANKNRISKLLRFHSARNDSLVSLENYIERMKKGQTDIYYLGGETLESIKASPLLEGLLKRGYDVLLLPEPIDEYTIGALGKYDGKFTFTDISKEGLKLSTSEEEKLKEYTERFTILTEYLKDTLSDRVSKVSVSTKLVNVPCVIVSQSWGYSANMERILKAQALKDDRYSAYMTGKRVLEINPRHPIIKRLLEVVENAAQDETTVDIVNVLYDTSVLNSGYAIASPSEVSGRINKLLATALQVDPSAEVEEEVFEDDVEEQEQEQEQEQFEIPPATETDAFEIEL